MLHGREVGRKERDGWMDACCKERRGRTREDEEGGKEGRKAQEGRKETEGLRTKEGEKGKTKEARNKGRKQGRKRVQDEGTL